MKTNFLTHLVPTLPPQRGTAGIYALDLACQLREQHGVNSQFIICDPKWDGPGNIEGFFVRRLRAQNEAGIWSLLASLKENPAVLLHYDGYGYHKHGVPSWLYRGIKSWLGEPRGGLAQYQRQFSTIFHELWTPSAKPWESRYFLQVFQKRLVKQIHRRSQVSITGTKHKQVLLNAIDPTKTLLFPIPQNAPAIDRTGLNAALDEPLRVAILGCHRFRADTIKAHINLLRALDKSNRLAGVMLMGKGSKVVESIKEDVTFLQKFISPGRIEVLSEFSADDISPFLSRANLFLSPERGEIACQSEIFMAALAAGCPAVLRDGRTVASLQENEHFIASDDSPASVKRFEQIAVEGRLKKIATAGRLWYEQYADWKIIAQKYQEIFLSRVQTGLIENLQINQPLWSLPIPAR